MAKAGVAGTANAAATIAPVISFLITSPPVSGIGDSLLRDTHPDAPRFAPRREGERGLARRAGISKRRRPIPRRSGLRSWSPGVGVTPQPCGSTRVVGRGRKIERQEMMNRMMIRLVSVAVAGLLALAGVAVANGNGAKTYRADLVPVNPAATTAGLPTVVGKSQLVDGKKNNKVSLHMRNLAADTTYLWHVHEGTCAATGAPVAGWTYRTQDIAGNGTLTSGASGNANTKGKSATFNADPAKSYSVNV